MNTRRNTPDGARPQLDHVLVAASVALALGLAPAALADDDFYQTLEAAPDGLVEIYNVAGRIQVQGTDSNEVEVSARFEDGVKEVVFEREGDVTVIRVEVEKQGRGWGRGWDGDARLEVRIPRTSDLFVEAVSADVSVGGVDGRLDLSSVSGDIEIESRTPSLEAKTMSGDVGFSGSGQDVVAALASVSGDVGVYDVGGDVHTSSVSGELVLELRAVSRLRAQSTSGDVAAKAQLMNNARVELETVSGEAQLRIEGDRGGDYTLSTFSGDLENCFGPEPEERRYSPGRSVKFREGSGDRTVNVSSMSGSIVVCD